MGNGDRDGSRWNFPVYEGLIDPKHQEQMGPAIWLYLYCLQYAFVARNQGTLRYNHIDAAEELGVSNRTVKRWFETLQEHSYLTIRARKRYHLEVTISNWRTVEEWRDAKQREGGTSPPISDDTTQDTSSAMRSDRNADAYILSIMLPGYIYPNGSHGDTSRISLSDAFMGLLAKLKESKNQPAALRKIYQLCFGGSDDSLPEYGYLMKVANKVGGPERLAQIMWELTTRPPADPLTYIIKGYADKKNGEKYGPDRKHPSLGDPDETFFDPSSQQLVRRDPDTGDLVPVP